MSRAPSVPQFTISLPTADFDALLFDCDGTLIDSMHLHWRAWQAALDAQGFPGTFSWQLLHELAGRSIPDTVAILNQRFGTSIDAARVEADRERHFFAHMKELRLVEPVVDLARRHHGAARLAVGSGSNRPIVLRELEHFGLTDLFGAIVTADDVPRAKPYPDIWLKAAADLGVRSERCIVIEDAQSGVEAARAAGMAAVLIPPVATEPA